MWGLFCGSSYSLVWCVLVSLMRWLCSVLVFVSGSFGMVMLLVDVVVISLILVNFRV